MKKYYLPLYAMLFSAVLCFTGCNDFLDVSPDERMEIDNLDKVYQTVTGATRTSTVSGFTHMSSDDVSAVKGVNQHAGNNRRPVYMESRFPEPDASGCSGILLDDHVQLHCQHQPCPRGYG